MEKLTISQGDSTTIAIVLPVEKMSQVEEVVVYVKNKLVARKSDNTLLSTNVANVFQVRLSSLFTQTLSNEAKVIVAVDYLDLGVRKVSEDDCLQLIVKSNNNQFTNDSVSLVVDATITIAVVEGDLVQNVTLAQINRGDSAYETAVNNGFEGTEAEWLESLKVVIQTSATFSAIGNGTSKRFIHVVADETNEGETTLYFHDSLGLNYIPTRKLY